MMSLPYILVVLILLSLLVPLLESTPRPAETPIVALRPLGDVRLRINVTATAYSSTPDQTDSDPFITSSGKHVRHGTLALSRDLLPLLPFGTKVWLLVGRQAAEFTVEDTMGPSAKMAVDVWMETREQANKFGRRPAVVEMWR